MFAMRAAARNPEDANEITASGRRHVSLWYMSRDQILELGRQWAEAELRSDVQGQFRATQVFARKPEGWLMASLHLSPIGQPPPWTGSSR